MPKKKVHKKGKVDPQVEEQIQMFKDATERRFEIANAAYGAQDEKTQRVLDSIVNQLMIGASGTITVFTGGKRKESVPVKVGVEYTEMNALYVATEILKDLAMMDVKVAGYKFPKVYCAECGEQIKKGKKHGKAKR